MVTDMKNITIEVQYEVMYWLSIIIYIYIWP